jgi:hypothetical protein
MAKATIETSAGEKVTGEVVRREGGPTLGELFGQMATFGLMTPGEARVTVRDSAGNHWSGTEK